MDPVPAQADATEPTTVPHAACRSLGRQAFRKKRREPAWERLIAKVYEVDLAGSSPCPAGLRRQPFRRNGESPRLRAGRVAAERTAGAPCSVPGVAHR